MLEARGAARGGTLVLGGGFAGSYVARLLGERGATIVSLENFMLFTPLLPEAASGTLEPRHIVVPLRLMCPHAELLLGRLTASTRASRTGTVETGGRTFEVGYDQAVLALGSISRAPADSRPRRARPRLQGPGGRDPSPQPRPARLEAAVVGATGTGPRLS